MLHLRYRGTMFKVNMFNCEIYKTRMIQGKISIEFQFDGIHSCIYALFKLRMIMVFSCLPSFLKDLQYSKTNVRDDLLAFMIGPSILNRLHLERPHGLTHIQLP